MTGVSYGEIRVVGEEFDWYWRDMAEEILKLRHELDDTRGEVERLQGELEK